MSLKRLIRQLAVRIVQRIDQRYLWTVMILVIIADMVLFVDSIRRALVYRVEFPYGEGTTLYLVQHPHLVYEPLSQAPYVVTPYTPLYLFVVAPVAQFLGDAFVAGRLVTIGASIITASLIAGIIYAIRPRSFIIPLLTAALFLLSPIVARKWATYARVDMLGLVFAVGALYWFVTRTGWIRVTGCVGFCLLAGFAKQSLVAAPIAILAALVWERNWWEAGLFVGVGVGVAGAVGFALIILTNGEVLKHIITYNRARGFALQWGLPQYARTLGIYGPLIGLVSIVGWRVRDQIPPIVGAYTTIGGFVASILLLRIGASLNHALEFITGLTLTAGLVVATYDHSTGFPLQDASRSAVVRGLFVVLILQFALFGLLGTFVANAHHPEPGEVKAATVISDADSPVLSSDVGIVVRTGVPTDMNDPAFVHHLATRGLWNPHRIRAKISHQEYAYIVLRFDVANPSADTYWTDAELEAIRTHYHLLVHHGEYWVYAPD